MKPDKNQLIKVIQELLQQGTPGTQEDFVKLLQQQGISMNQARVSRILNKLGAVKMNEGGRVVYRLPAEITSVTPNNSLSQMVVGVSHNESMIVILTAPGSAQLVARYLDQKKVFGILGTVAGDDTILIVPTTIENIQEVSQKIAEALV